jgi:guanine deaminase
MKLYGHLKAASMGLFGATMEDAISGAREVSGMGVDEDQRWLTAAIDLAVENVGNGGGPFGAVVVRDEAVIGRGINRVTAELDPTAHAEVVAIRRACRAISDFSLAGATVYASCEPCPLCLSASLWARVPRVVFAADRHDAARAGFDDAVFHEVMSSRADPDILDVVQVPLSTAQRPFDAWLGNPGRTPY